MLCCNRACSRCQSSRKRHIDGTIANAELHARGLLHAMLRSIICYRYLTRLCASMHRVAGRSVDKIQLTMVINDVGEVYSYSFRLFFDAWSESSWNSLFVLKEGKFHRNESSRERKFLERSLPRNESSTGAKVPRSECSTERKFHLWTFRSRERKCRETKSPTLARHWSKIAIFSQLGDPRLNIAMTFCMEKLEWCGYPMVKKQEAQLSQRGRAMLRVCQ